MESVDQASGQIVGFDVDVVNAVCAKINCKAEFVTTGWDGIFAALDQGNFDFVASGVSITDERKKAMDFTDPYIVNSQAILVRVEDQGMKAVGLQGQGQEALGPDRHHRCRFSPQALVGKENVVAFDTFSASVLALKNKDVDGVVINGANADSYEKEFAGELVAPVRGLSSDPLGLVFRKGDANVAAFNEGIKAIQDDGTLAKLIAKYWTAK